MSAASVEWSLQINALLSLRVAAKAEVPGLKGRVLALVKRHGVVTVAAASAEFGVRDATARRALDDLTPDYLRIVEGRPKRWRVK